MATPNKELDWRPTPDLELRFAPTEAASRRLEGYAARFGAKTKIRGWAGDFTEWLEPGCFADALAKGGDVRALFEHDPHQLLARTSAGNLTLTEDAKGLRFVLELPDTTLGRDVIEQVRVGNLRGMSFGFRPVKMDQEFDAAGKLLSVAHRAVDLREITITSLPAYSQTSVALRSAVEAAAPGDLTLRYRLLALSVPV